MSLRTPPILCADRIGIFYFRFLLFWRKVSNATTNIPTATIKDATAKIVETISYAVITPPPFLCIPVSWFHRLGRLPPCHGASHIVMIAHIEHMFNHFRKLLQYRLTPFPPLHQVFPNLLHYNVLLPLDSYIPLPPSYLLHLWLT